MFLKKQQSEKRKRSLKARILLLLIIGVLLAALAVAVKLYLDSQKDDKEVIPTILEQTTHPAEVTFTESQLQDILETSELSTATYTYNSIVSALAEDGVTVRYHVSYEGTVKAGVDFAEIDMEIDNENKTILLVLPDAEVLDTSVDAGTLDYIFSDSKFNTETIAQEAYALSCTDLESKIEQEEQLYVIAKENAVAAVEALIKPWVEQIDANYIVSVR